MSHFLSILSLFMAEIYPEKGRKPAETYHVFRISEENQNTARILYHLKEILQYFFPIFSHNLLMILGKNAVKIPHLGGRGHPGQRGGAPCRSR